MRDGTDHRKAETAVVVRGDERLDEACLSSMVRVRSTALVGVVYFRRRAAVWRSHTGRWWRLHSSATLARVREQAAAVAGRMNENDRPYFEPDALRDRAGEKAYARGEGYYRNGHVRILAVEPGRVLAQVTGTGDYRTVLTGHGNEPDGTCSCPAFEDRGFCKHLVATALAANAAGYDADGQGAGALSIIADYLKEKSVDSLVEMIVKVAERDPALFRRLDMAASAAARANDAAHETHLRRAIDRATLATFVDYREASGWAADVGSALDVIAGIASDGRHDLALKLVERAIERIERALEDIDDFDGHCSQFLSRARDIHLIATRAARPEPVQLARDLFAREMKGDYGTFDGAAAIYADVLGEEGFAEYRRLAVKAWRKLPPLSDRVGERDDMSGDYHRLQEILDFFAARDGDTDARIALRAKDLSSPWRYLQLAEFCLSQGREEEALRRAEDGIWVFEDRWLDARLVFFAVELLSKAGRNADAEAHLWRAFEKAPSIDVYERLRKIGGGYVRSRAAEILEAGLGAARRIPGHFSADLLIHILVHERMFDAAWTAVRKHGASDEVKERLALASETTHRREALDVYGKRVDQLAAIGGNPAYTEAARLIRRMAGLQGAAEQAAYVAMIRERFGRKRNFMKLLA